MNINARRLAVLNYIRDRVDTQGQPPTLAEIATACGFKSRSGARKHVLALQASGLLEGDSSGKARSARPKASPKGGAVFVSGLFEVSVADIQALSDVDLRELVGRLCIARLADKGYPPEHVIWGGDQRAPDGGIDVRCQMPPRLAKACNFPCPPIGFQVKAMKMPRKEIQKEMCPGGMLRPSIRELVRARGAYIIASSDTVSQTGYDERIAAMQQAAAQEPHSEQAKLDFYDARRLADWTNQHPGVVAWVRSSVGRSLQGWRPYGQWADTRGGKKHEFVDDAVARLVDPADPTRKFSLAEGLSHVRSLLRRGGSSVRIAGLSGVGKTRFAQGLFEEQAAAGALVPDLAVYCDTADSPAPPPQALLDELLANGRRAVLIVDNCSSQLHSQLTARCKAAAGVSLLTIEYDIREDFPDETNVFRLEPGSPELITKVLEQQFPHISRVNIGTITNFAEGNSRVAIALANTLDHKDSLAGLSNDALFERLFWQGRQVNPDLLVAAEVCALVYSFDGEDQQTELAQLAALADMTTLDLYRHVEDLFKRGLVQKRGPWRAILPHAIANALAKRALSLIPRPFILSGLGQGRLLRSFSRRLGYLHDCPEAVGIVRNWFAAGGLLADLVQMPGSTGEILQNVAAVDPGGTLSAIERAATGGRATEFTSMDSFNRSRVVRILRSIAWEAKYFDRCLNVMLKFALAEPADNRADPTLNVIKSMFGLYLSGTHATAAQRINWVRAALASNDRRVQDIGLACLDSALESHHFSSVYAFDFGARSRDYGSSPKGSAARDWFAKFISLATEVGLQPSEIGRKARDLLASNFRSLWTIARMHQALADAVTQLTSRGWEKGWLAVKQTKRFDARGMPEEVRERLDALEELTRPRTLSAQTNAVVLSGFQGGVDVTDGDDRHDAYERADQLAKDLGKQVAADRSVFAELLPRLVENRQGRQWMFGAGLAAGVTDPAEGWKELVAAFERTEVGGRNVQVLRGYLNGLQERDPALFETLLDGCMTRPSLASWVPALQLSAPLNARGCERLLAAMENPGLSADSFQLLGYGRATHDISDQDVKRLLERLARKANGLEVALDVLSMHVYDEKRPVDPVLVELGRELLARYSPSRFEGQRMDFAIKGLVEIAFRGSAAEPQARAMLRKIAEGFENYTLSPYDIDDTLSALFEAQPLAALDELVGDDDDLDRHHARRRGLRADHGHNPLKTLPVQTLLDWCAQGDSKRWTHVAAAVPAFTTDPDGEGQLHWSEGALALVRNAPNPVDVAAELVHRIEPMSWTGSRAELLVSRLPLLDELADILGAPAAPKVEQWREQLERLIERERSRELEEHRVRNERFE